MFQEKLKGMNIPQAEVKKLSPVSSSIVKALLYFDIFDYPLLFEEIKEYNNTEAAEVDLTKALDELVKNKSLCFQDGFYFLPEKHEIVGRRKDGNQLAEKYFKIAMRVSRFISYFPFVRCVCISGTLSKNYFDKNSDIDYFIITAPNRLWLCRTMLVLFKKTVLLNSKKYFCVNYFVDTENLEIPDKNIFTATELVHVRPTYNSEVYNKFMANNNWVKTYYPYKTASADVLPASNNPLKKALENIFNSRWGEILDKWCFRLTIKHQKRKFPEFNEEEFDLNLRSRKNVSKHHPQGFQFKVLKAYDERIKWFEDKFTKLA